MLEVAFVGPSSPAGGFEIRPVRAVVAPAAPTVRGYGPWAPSAVVAMSAGLLLGHLQRCRAHRGTSGLPRRRSQLRASAVVDPPQKVVLKPLKEELCLADQVRRDFPALSGDAYRGVKLVYLDSAATSQKPTCVLEALQHYYESSANVHRGAHALAERATKAFEDARASVAKLIHAGSAKEIIFTSGATDGINLVANTWGSTNIRSGDEIVLTVMEHHSNLVPWQLLCQRTGATLKHARLLPGKGGLDLEHLKSLLSPRTKLVALAHVSNVLGCINPVEKVVAAAKEVGATVLLDACQSVPHFPIDVGKLGIDFLVASGHKMCGPTGVGFLWGKPEILESMPPWKGGGEMINEVFLDRSTFAEVPARFEAGTPPIAQAVGLGAACEYLMKLGMDRIEKYEQELASYLWEGLSSIEGLELYGPAPSRETPRAALVAFNDKQEDVYAQDIASLLDSSGVAIRAGHHCAQPLHRELGLPFGSARASLYFYNTRKEVDQFVEALKENLEMLRAGEGCMFDPDDPEACHCSSDRMRS